MSNDEMNRLFRAQAQPRLQLVTENGRTQIVAIKDEVSSNTDGKEANNDQDADGAS